MFYAKAFLSVFEHRWLGISKGIRPVKSWVLVCWWWCFVLWLQFICHHHIRHP